MVIITRYLVRETLKNQLAILFILFLIFFCQKLIRILSATVDGNIQATLILFLLGFGVLEMIQLILPLSLFLGLLITLSRMHAESEIIAMHACGLDENVSIRAVLILSLITTVFATANVIWFSPWSSRHQNLIKSEAKTNPGMLVLSEKQFKLIKDGNSVLFIGNTEGKKFKNVFLAQFGLDSNNRLAVTTANQGYIIQQPDGSQLVSFDQGTRYEGTALLLDFCITDFIKYKAIISHRTMTSKNYNSASAQMTMRQLWRTQIQEPEARAELHWRLTLIVSVLIMALLAIRLSVVNPRQGRLLNILPAMFLYLIFFLLQTSLRSNGAKGKLDPMLWMWMVNIIYLGLVIVPNLWNSASIKKKLRIIKSYF